MALSLLNTITVILAIIRLRLARAAAYETINKGSDKDHQLCIESSR